MYVISVAKFAVKHGNNEKSHQHTETVDHPSKTDCCHNQQQMISENLKKKNNQNFCYFHFQNKNVINKIKFILTSFRYQFPILNRNKDKKTDTNRSLHDL